jgi:hypothetical protein
MSSYFHIKNIINERYDEFNKLHFITAEFEDGSIREELASNKWHHTGCTQGFPHQPILASEFLLSFLHCGCDDWIKKAHINNQERDEMREMTPEKALDIYSKYSDTPYISIIERIKNLKH